MQALAPFVLVILIIDIGLAFILRFFPPPTWRVMRVNYGVMRVYWHLDALRIFPFQRYRLYKLG